MNNLITINFADPIREEYNQAIDKTAALNTIAFKYFKGDRIEAHNYLSENYIDSVEKDYDCSFDCAVFAGTQSNGVLLHHVSCSP